MKLFKQWIRKHPIKLVILFCYSMLCGFLWAAVDPMLGLAAVVMGYGLWCLVYAADTQKIICASIIVALLSVPTIRAQEFKPAAGYVIGGVVIIVGAGLGWVGCKIKKACDKIAATKTNLPPEEFFLAGATPRSLGAAFFWSDSGYCNAERLLPVIPTVLTLDINVVSLSNVSVAASVDSAATIQTWDEFREEMFSNGLIIPAAPNNSAAYSIGGHPCESHQVPISFNFTTRTATIGRGGILVWIERSNDLKEWEPLLSIDVEAGKRIRLPDVSSDRAFYRVTTRAEK